VVILTSSGLTDIRISNDPIPWSAIRDIQVESYEWTKWAHLEIDDPEVIASLRPTRMAKFSRLFGGSGLDAWVQARGLTIGQDEFLNAILDRWKAAKASTPTKKEDEGKSPARATEIVGATGLPVVTIALVALLAIVFVGEIALAPSTTGLDLSLSPDALEQYGGLVRPLISRGDWWRLFTAPLLHSDLLHLVFNCGALAFIGVKLERQIGSAWFAGIFAGSALAGSLMSAALNAPTIVSVGASGGIVGLLAAAAVVSRHFPPGPDRSTLMKTAIWLLIPALIPGAMETGGDKIDYAGHFGGALGGAGLGALLLALWPQERHFPRFAPFAKIGAILFGLVGAFGIASSVRNMRQPPASASSAAPGAQNSAATPKAQGEQQEAITSTRSQPPIPEQELVFDNWNADTCSLTNQAGFSLGAPKRIVNIELWRRWQRGETTASFEIVQKGKTLQKGKLARGACDRHQPAWCLATAELAFSAPAGNYRVRVGEGRLCRNAKSGLGFLKVRAESSAKDPGL
jgi:membrane associated rhomboid family serine protease